MKMLSLYLAVCADLARALSVVLHHASRKVAGR